MKSIAQLIQSMERRETTSRALVEQYLANAADPAGEGARVYLKLDPDAMLRAADECDRQRESGVQQPLLGVSISVKDLCDVAGEVTLAGSIALKDSVPAKQDAP